MSDNSENGPIGIGRLPLKRTETVQQKHGASMAPGVRSSLTGRTMTRVLKPVPTSTRTQVPTSTRASVPTPTSTRAPTPTSTRAPTPTSTRAPTPTSTRAPAPTPTSTRAPTPTPTRVFSLDPDAESSDTAIATLRRDYPKLDPTDIRGLNPNPAKIAPGAFVPPTSTGFTRFIWTTYGRYSQYVEREIKSAAAALTTVDKDACKRRDPNKIETFYYQKFVRDYLGGGTPYRGLLIYHGLGSGKTCTSIAATEALIWGGRKTIWILTPATLNNNFRQELGKCGFFPLRKTNHWRFMPINPTTDVLALSWLTHGILGLPEESIVSQRGAWIPNPDAPSNWESLSAEEQAAIETQQKAHLNHRFKFIHYNGVSPEWLAEKATEGARTGKNMFDNSVVVVDEIHNLVRTINGTRLAGKTVAQIIDGGTEPREANWSTPIADETPGYRYPRGYSLYRLLTNAVGVKFIALSATPMINYAQELAILTNLIGGEYRVAEIAGVTVSDAATIKAWGDSRSDVDFCAMTDSMLTLTPVPFGFAKRVNPETGTREFVPTSAKKQDKNVKHSRERNMESWAASIVEDLIAKKMLGLSKEPAVIKVYPILPEDSEIFVDQFVDRATLAIKKPDVLKARVSGLISFYRGGGDELMPRTIRNDVVRVPMSSHMFKEYISVRKMELDMKTPEKKDTESAKASRSTKGRLDVDLYALATKPPQTGFLALSRAACNWAFPDEIERPDRNNIEQRKKLLGLAKKKKGDKKDDDVVDEEEDVATDVDTSDDAAAPDEPAGESTAVLDKDSKSIAKLLLRALDADADKFLNVGLLDCSPKYAAMVANIRKSPGPVLVYSQFLTLEGLGIFSAALRASPEEYYELDIVKQDGEWRIPDDIMDAAKDRDNRAARRPRYILYTGANSHEKRRLLLKLYNADLKGLPPTLSKQCAKLLRYGDAEDNRAGDVCRAFMITASGSEGISLANTRQVHIMEPYWNNVRLLQVIGRAIRLCSHMNLPWEDRTVEVFTYLSVFTAEQKLEAKEVMTADGRMTTDEVIFDIATKKQKLADGLFEIAQAAAVDCELHRREHGEVTKCFSFARKPGESDFMTHPNWRNDMSSMMVRAATAATTVRRKAP